MDNKRFLDAYMCDFETLNDNEEYTYVWAWAACNVSNTDNIKYGTTIESYINFIKNKKLAYFHNAKFDFGFILDYLLKHGYKYYEHDARITPELKENEKDPRIKTFTIIKADNNQTYSMDITWNVETWIDKDGNKRTKRVHTELRDSYKLIPFKVEKIAKDYKVGVVKGKIDYKAHYNKGGVLKKEFKEYIRNDVVIVAKVLKIFFDEGYTDLTIGSNALRVFKSMLSGEKFNELMPQLDYEVDEFCRKSYRGGFTFVNPKYASLDIAEGLVLDVNSLYPDRMYNCYLPYGEPVYYTGEYKKDNNYPLYIAHINISFNLKRNHIPCIQLKNNSLYQETEYLRKSNDGETVELYCTSVDLNLIKKQYNCKIEYIDGYKFKQCKGIFKDYIDYFMQIKAENSESKNALYQIAKLFLNNLYGKLGTNPLRVSKRPYLDEEKEIVSYTDNDAVLGKSVYIPMATFITAYGREKTITVAQENYKRFLYADTDSVHLRGSDLPTNLEIHKSKLGAWDLETRFRRARFIRSKTYIEEYFNKDKNDWVFNIKCAGLPDHCHSQVTWDNFKMGVTYNGKLRPKTVKGGIVLVDCDFHIK